jgi:predicted MPP superfamily phosphohydrolase
LSAHFSENMLRVLLTSSISAAVLGLSRYLSPSRSTEWVDVNPLSLTLPRLAPEFDGYRIVHISDFHIGTWLNRSRLDEAIELVNRQSPDLVAITGDFVMVEPELYISDLETALAVLRTKDGTVAVLGNHDHWTDPHLIRQMLRSSGVKELTNSHLTIKRGDAQLHIAGVDDFMEELDRLDLVINGLPSQGSAILLAHEPDFAEVSSKTGRFDLQLSGHTHGGQVRILHLKPPILPELGQKYPIGLYKVKDMYQYTNRGLGTSSFQLRLNCRPEITVLTLRSPITSEPKPDRL